MVSIPRGLTAALLLFIARMGAAQSSVVHMPVALSSTAAPAVGGGASGNFTSFTGPVVNDAGQVAFSANASAGGNGIFVGAPGAVQAVGRTGGPTPAVGGGTNGTYTSLINPSINASGQVAFYATASAGGAGFFVGAPGSVQGVARIGSAAPGVGGGSGGVYTAFPRTSDTALNNAGQMAFRGVSSIGGEKIFGGAPGMVQAAAQIGGPAPAQGGGTSGTYVTFDFTSPDFNPAINAQGKVLFVATSTTSNGDGVYEGAPGAVQAVARRGGAAPPSAGGGSFIDTYSVIERTPVINATGQVAFAALVDGPGINDSGGLFVGVPGSVQAAVRSGQPAPLPGGGTNGVFSRADFEVPSIKEGQLAFRGGRRGIYAVVDGIVRGVADAGGAVPLMPGDIDATFTLFQRPLVNAAGQVAFMADMTTPGIGNNGGLFAWDPVAGLSVVARRGQQVDIDPTAGVLSKTISDFTFDSTGGDGQTGFADNGWLAYRLSFTDGVSGVFVTRIGAEPAPGDYNRDGLVNAADYNSWRQAYGATVTTLGAGADGNRDGHIDAADYTVWRDHYAPGPAPSQSVPEPAAAVTLFLGLLLGSRPSKSGRRPVGPCGTRCFNPPTAKADRLAARLPA